LGFVKSEQATPVMLELLAPELKRTLAELKGGPRDDRVFVGLCAELRKRAGQKIGNDVLAWHDWWAVAHPGQGGLAPLDRLVVRGLMDDYRKLRPIREQ
jgi:hypothetical protein